jgi:galactonate dehydratase
VRIEKIETYTVPPRWIFVRVVTDDGLAGWGEAIVPKRVNAVLGAIQDLAENIKGADANRIEDLWQRMHKDAFFRGGPILGTAAAALEQALWDIKGRRYGLPVYDFLGGVVRERVRTYVWVGGDQPQDVVAHTRQRLEQGFTAVKMNVAAQLDYLEPHAAIEAVVQRVASLREAFGGDLGIAVDFHGRAHLTLARMLLRELEPYHLMWVEEPLTPEYDESLPELARTCGATPIATGERRTSRWEFKQLLADGGADIWQPDVSLTGLFEMAKICRMAETYDIAVAPHSPNGPISLAASLQVACCCPNIAIHELSQGIHYHQGYRGLPAGELTDYLQNPEVFSVKEGYLARPQGSGLGIEVDVGAVKTKAAKWRLLDSEWRHADGRLAEW